MSGTTTTCIRCGRSPRTNPHGGLGYMTVCSGCYDGASDSATRHDFGVGRTVPESERSWNASMAFAAEAVPT